MPVRFLLGPAGSGKTRYCVQALQELERRSSPAIYLVPEQSSYISERGLLSAPGLAGLRHVRVFSFSRFAWWLRDLAGDYTWRDPAELKKEYEQLGVTPDKRIIIYCSKGYRSTTTYVTLKHLLGYPNVAVYDGSFSEWSDAADMPVATGPK